MNSEIILPLIVSVFVSAAAGFLGSFVILRRMALVGDALSHVALPGMALGLIFHFNPFWGAFVFLTAAVLGIWFLEYYSKLPLDALVGIFFSASLALGVIIAPAEEIIEALFGDIKNIAFNEALVAIVLSLVLIFILFLFRKKMVLNIVSEELARASGVNNKKTELIFLLVFALAVALGIKFVGALLMGALVIIPPASAKNVAKSLSSFMILSVIFSVLAAFLGVLTAFSSDYSPGPIFVLFGGLIFLSSLLVRKFKSKNQPGN